MSQKDNLISRQAAIDKFEPWLKVRGYSEGELNMLKAVLYELRFLPSVQPEILACGEGELNVPDTNVGDMIHRQAAIDALRTHERKPSNKWFDNQLDIEWNNAIDICCYDIEDLPSEQPEQRWIPCSERLPEHGGRYLISVLDGINRRTTVAPYLPRCKAWAMNGRMAYWKVIAWLPLPEPYREEEQDG